MGTVGIEYRVLGDVGLIIDGEPQSLPGRRQRGYAAIERDVRALT